MSSKNLTSTPWLSQSMTIYGKTGLETRILSPRLKIDWLITWIAPNPPKPNMTSSEVKLAFWVENLSTIACLVESNPFEGVYPKDFPYKRTSMTDSLMTSQVGYPCSLVGSPKLRSTRSYLWKSGNSISSSVMKWRIGCEMLDLLALTSGVE